MLEQEINLLVNRAKDALRVPEQMRRERIDLYANGLLCEQGLKLTRSHAKAIWSGLKV